MDYVDNLGNYEATASLEQLELVLYAGQESLPRLIVPAFQETMKYFVESIRPFVTVVELEQSLTVIERFMATIGPKLQKRLVKRRNTLGKTSWLQEWWNHCSYLEYRASIVHNVSFYFQFKDEHPFAMDRCRRTARFVHKLIKFRNSVVNGDLEPDKIKSSPLCSTQWKFMFNSCRIPGERSDFVRLFSPSKYNHIVVLRKSRAFLLQVFDYSKQRSLSIDELEKTFHQIISFVDASQTSNGSWIGKFTSDRRDFWYENYNELCSLESNVEKLKQIQSSIFCVCFDDVSPQTREEAARYLLHSRDNQNRFWDKTIQVICFDNGKMGWNGEHSMADGMISNRIINTILDETWAESESIKCSSLNSTIDLGFKDIREISFDLSEDLKSRIKRADRSWQTLTELKEHRVLNFQAFGLDGIKALNCSPDAFMQIAIQLAYFRSFGKCCATYESLQMRKFLHGRTEANRSCTSQALCFCQAMLNPKALNSARVHLLQEALNTHTKNVKRSSNGNGIDRHLFGLKMSLQENEDSSFFDHFCFKRSSRWMLSTSRLDGEHIDGIGFGEVVEDGLGICYSMKNESIGITVSSGMKDLHAAAIFIDALELSLLQIKQLIQETSPKSNL